MKHLLLLSFLLICVANLIAQDRLDSLISVLKKEIDQQDIYVDRKRQRIALLQEHLNQRKSASASFDLYNELYHEYKTFSNDSAFKYAKQLIATSGALNDKTKIAYSNLKYGFTLLSAGMFKETFDALKTIKVSDLADSSRFEYYRLSARAYADLMIYNDNKYFSPLYRKYYEQHMDSALAHCGPKTYAYYYLTIVKNLHLKNYKDVLEIGQELENTHTLTWPQYAVFHYDMAEAHFHLGEQQRGLEHLAMSSICDIRGAVKETAAMHGLARLLNLEGNSEDAYIFIRQAFKDARYYGARQRQVEINAILPLIAADRLTNIEEKRKRWVAYSGGVTLIVVIVTLFSFIIYRQLKKIRLGEARIKQANQRLKDFNQKLVEANKIKEEYVGYYFNMTTEYVNRIDTLRKQIMNYLVNDKKKEALALLGKYNPADERAKFVKDFDQVFLKLFPDFVHQFNELIAPEEALVPDAEGGLNTDLRIFALIRLGITDNKKIGEILNFSVNTVYAYKTRVKNKSIVPGEEFINRIMKIKSVEDVSLSKENDVV